MNSETISILIYVGIGILALFILLYGIGFTSIGTDEVGIVEKWWSLKGSVPADGLIALKGEAGYQPHVLRAGVHFKTPFKYKVKKVRLVTIPQGQIGYVFARSGESLADGQTLGKVIPECKSFQDVVAFLNNRGQKGPQRQILREGTYAFNLAQFIIITKDKVHSIFTSKDESEQIETMRSDLLRVNGFIPVVISSSKILNKMNLETILKLKIQLV
ncbi:putative membrane protein YqiK [Clostridium beijerinckii]|nr:putative membrane protein YqiK [Clostridium beijerinckii]